MTLPWLEIGTITLRTCIVYLDVYVATFSKKIITFFKIFGIERAESGFVTSILQEQYILWLTREIFQKWERTATQKP